MHSSTFTILSLSYSPDYLLVRLTGYHNHQGKQVCIVLLAALTVIHTQHCTSLLAFTVWLSHCGFTGDNRLGSSSSSTWTIHQELLAVAPGAPAGHRRHSPVLLQS